MQYIPKTLLFLSLLLDVSVIYSAILFTLPVHFTLFRQYLHLIFSKLLFNYLTPKLFKFSFCYCSIVKTGLIFCFLFSFNRILRGSTVTDVPGPSSECWRLGVELSANICQCFQDICPRSRGITVAKPCQIYIFCCRLCWIKHSDHWFLCSALNFVNSNIYHYCIAQ